MIKIKSLLTTFTALGLVVVMQFGMATKVMAKTQEIENSEPIWIEMEAKENDGDDDDRWLRLGPVYQHPSEGGVWQYGFWKVRVVPITR